MELSDLKMYNGLLLTVDDKTGIVYRWVNVKSVRIIFRFKGNVVVPWVIFADADGNSEKRLKFILSYIISFQLSRESGWL